LKSIKPLHAQCFFSVSRRGEFHQFLTYDYYDPRNYYAKLVYADEKKYLREMLRLMYGMQELLDTEVVKINGVRVRPRVLSVDMEHRGLREVPYITWLIWFKGRIKRGVNVFENVSEEEVAEYDYEVVWLFPKGAKVLEVHVPTDYEIVGDRALFIWARKGDKVGGLEKIVFEVR